MIAVAPAVRSGLAPDQAGDGGPAVVLRRAGSPALDLRQLLVLGDRELGQAGVGALDELLEEVQVVAGEAVGGGVGEEVRVLPDEGHAAVAVVDPDHVQVGLARCRSEPPARARPRARPSAPPSGGRRGRRRASGSAASGAGRGAAGASRPRRRTARRRSRRRRAPPAEPAAGAPSRSGRPSRLQRSATVLSAIPIIRSDAFSRRLAIPEPTWRSSRPE